MEIPDDTTELGDYLGDSPFVRLLATRGRVKILDLFLRRPASEFTSDQIAAAADIDKSTFSRNKRALEALDIIKSRKEGRRSVYELNTDNPVVDILVEAHTELLDYAPDIIERTTIQEEEYIGRMMTVDSAHAEEVNLDANVIRSLQDQVGSQDD